MTFRIGGQKEKEQGGKAVNDEASEVSLFGQVHVYLVYFILDFA